MRILCLHTAQIAIGAFFPRKPTNWDFWKIILKFVTIKMLNMKVKSCFERQYDFRIFFLFFDSSIWMNLLWRWMENVLNFRNFPLHFTAYANNTILDSIHLVAVESCKAFSKYSNHFGTLDLQMHLAANCLVWKLKWILWKDYFARIDCIELKCAATISIQIA